MHAPQFRRMAVTSDVNLLVKDGLGRYRNAAAIS